MQMESDINSENMEWSDSDFNFIDNICGTGIRDTDTLKATLMPVILMLQKKTLLPQFYSQLKKWLTVHMAQSSAARHHIHTGCIVAWGSRVLRRTL